MEAKLKGMKVTELKGLLQQANVTFSAKLTKPDLIKKIMESPAASAIASAPGDAPAEDDEPDLPPTTDFFAAPKVTTNAPVATTSPPKFATVVPSAEIPRAPHPTPAAGAASQSPAATSASPPKEADSSAFKAPDIAVLSLEDEAAKRRARAAKWGTTFVEPITQPTPSVSKKATKASAVASTSAEVGPNATTQDDVSSGEQDVEKRKAREARFGSRAAAAAATSAPAPADEEEVRKRKAREERFGPNKKPRVEAPAGQS